MLGFNRLLVSGGLLLVVGSTGWFYWSARREADAVERVKIIEASLLAKGSLEQIGSRLVPLQTEPILADIMNEASGELSQLRAKLQAVELGLMQSDVPTQELQSRIGYVNERLRLWGRILDEGGRDLLMLQARAAHALASLRAPKEVVDELASRLGQLLADAASMVRTGNFDGAAEVGRVALAAADVEVIASWSALEDRARDLLDRLGRFNCVGPADEARIVARFDAIVKKGRSAFLFGKSSGQEDWGREFDRLYRIVEFGMRGCGVPVERLATEEPFAQMLPRSLVDRASAVRAELRSALVDFDELRAGKAAEMNELMAIELKEWHSGLAAVVKDESVWVDVRGVVSLDLATLEQVAFRSRLTRGVDDLNALKVGAKELRQVLVRSWLEWASDQPLGSDAKIVASANKILSEWGGETRLEAVEAVRDDAIARGAELKSIDDILGGIHRLKPWVAKAMEKEYGEALGRGIQIGERAHDPACTRGELPGLLSSMTDLASAIRRIGADQWDAGCERLAKLLAEDGFSVPSGVECGALTLGLPRRIVHDATGIELLLMPPGKVTIGSPPDEPGRDSDEVQRQVVVARPLYMGRFEVSRQEWALGGGKTEAGVVEDPKLPMSGISGEDAIAFLKSAGGRLRLPTEEEWEYACRSGAHTPFWYGLVAEKNRVNCLYGSSGPNPKAVPCGALPCNEWGLHEMHGNVWELCSATANLEVAAAEIRSVNSGASEVVARGGSFQDEFKNVRAASRMPLSSRYRGSSVGIRVAYTPPSD